MTCAKLPRSIPRYKHSMCTKGNQKIHPSEQKNYMEPTGKNKFKPQKKEDIVTLPFGPKIESKLQLPQEYSMVDKDPLYNTNSGVQYS